MPILIKDNFLKCVHLETILTITVDSDIYTLLVESPRRSRPAPGIENFIVPFASKTILLDAPYADMLTQEFAGAMASATVASMVAIAGLSVIWQMVDWYIPSTVLYANNETPLDIIRKIVGAAGGVIQSAPDGSLICRSEYPISVPAWVTSPPDFYLTDMDNYFSVDSTPVIRDGYNKYLISNEDVGGSGLTLEQRDIDSMTKEVLVYRVPWDDSKVTTLETSGGSWVSIIDEGVRTEQLTEQVEFVSGDGSVGKPLYSLGAQDYKERDLGTITTSEDGSLETAVEDNSLADITYTTKYHLFRVSSPNIEDVQFYPVES